MQRAVTSAFAAAAAIDGWKTDSRFRTQSCRQNAVANAWWLDKQ
jgi:hypothetical protein